MLQVISHRRTLLCAAVALLLLAVMMTFVRAQEEVAASTDAASEPLAHFTSQTTEISEEGDQASTIALQAAEAEVAAMRQLEAEEKACRQREKEHRANAEELQEEEEDRQHEGEEEHRRQREEEERQRREKERQRQEEDRRRQEEERQQEERRRQEEERQQEERRRQEEEERQRREKERQHQEEDRRRQEEERQHEERRRQEEERQQEERRRQEEERQQEERRRQEEEERQRREKERQHQQEERRRQEEERAKRRIDPVATIRSSARKLPQGCVKSVEEYLFRVHEHRQRTAGAVRDARSELNEARLHTPQKVAELEKRLSSRQDELLLYDIKTLRMYGGSVPKTCIAEAQAWLERQSDTSSMSEYLQAHMHLFRITVAHFRILYLTARGVMQYMIDSYAPAIEFYTKSVQHYCDKAGAIYAELMPASGFRPEMPMMDLMKKVWAMVGNAAVPISLGVAAGVVTVTVLPPVVAGVLLYEYVYKVWVELFIAYYTYGAKMPEGAVTAVQSTVAAARAGEWATIGNNMLDALTDLPPDSGNNFYNVVLAMFLVSSVAVICAVFICMWCTCCVPGMRHKKSASLLHPASSSTTGNRNGNKKASATGGAAAVAARKKS